MTAKSYRVLRPFLFSRDGFTEERLEVDADASGIPEGMIAGLEAEGYITSEAAARPAKTKKG